MSTPGGPPTSLAGDVGVFVFGSCVSRDTLEFLPPEYSLLNYVARQSLISAFAPPRPATPALELLPSSFQRRMLTWDAGSHLPTLLRRASPMTDLVLWDLVDERLGVLQHPDGSITTDSVEQRANPSLYPDQSAVRRVPFGSDEHLHMFTRALVAWRALLHETGTLDRTVMIAPPWARESTTGAAVPTSFGLDAEVANRITKAYVDAALAVVNVPMLVTGPTRPLADPGHRWGFAPFHYDNVAYEAIACDIVGAARRIPPRRRGDRARLSGPVVRVSQTGPREVTVHVESVDMVTCAFHLFHGRTRLDVIPYGAASSHAFRVPAPGVYRCRVYVKSPSGERVAMTSPRMRVS